MKIFRLEKYYEGVFSGYYTYYWYPPGEIYFSSNQMIFLIDGYGHLEENQYPPEPTQGFIDEKILTPVRSVKKMPIDYKCEIDSRSKDVPDDYFYVLWDEIQAGLNEYERLSRTARLVLRYISGYKRRIETFRSFKNREKKAVELFRKPTNVGF